MLPGPTRWLPLRLPILPSSQAVTSAADSFRPLLEAHKWSSPSALATRNRQASDAAAAAAATAAAEGDVAAGGATPATPRGGGGGAPPPALVDHVPLAVYANGLLAAFNELRHCAPLSVQQPTAAALQESLTAVSAALAHYGLTHTLAEPQQRAFDAACKAHTATLCPYVAACYERIYPGGAALLDLRAVGKPLADMAAQKEEGS